MDPYDDEWVESFIGSHLAFELRQLLIAAVHWECRLPGDTLRDMCEYAAYVHARNLYQFLCVGRPDARTRELRSALGLTEAHPSPLYSRFSTALHEKAVHISVERPFVPTGTESDELHTKIGEFAADIRHEWALFADRMPPQHRGVIERVGSECEISAAAIRSLYRGDPI